MCVAGAQNCPDVDLDATDGKLTNEGRDLQRMCRKVIRGHMMRVDPQGNLFYRVARLPLPVKLQEFLLLGFSLRDEEDATERCRSGMDVSSNQPSVGNVSQHFGRHSMPTVSAGAHGLLPGPNRHFWRDTTRAQPFADVDTWGEGTLRNQASASESTAGNVSKTKSHALPTAQRHADVNPWLWGSLRDQKSAPTDAMAMLSAHTPHALLPTEDTGDMLAQHYVDAWCEQTLDNQASASQSTDISRHFRRRPRVQRYADVDAWCEQTLRNEESESSDDDVSQHHIMPRQSVHTPHVLSPTDETGDITLAQRNADIDAWCEDTSRRTPGQAANRPRRNRIKRTEKR